MPRHTNARQCTVLTVRWLQLGRRRSELASLTRGWALLRRFRCTRIAYRRCRLRSRAAVCDPASSSCEGSYQTARRVHQSSLIEHLDQSPGVALQGLCKRVRKSERNAFRMLTKCQSSFCRICWHRNGRFRNSDAGIIFTHVLFSQQLFS